MLYKKGFSYRFDPRACATCKGKCCTGSSGYIWCTLDEQQAIAEKMDIPLMEFQKRYVERIGSRYTFREYVIGKDDYACIFFDAKHRTCTIYDLRPSQCRTFPFWKAFKKHPELVIEECPGVRSPNTEGS